MQVYLDEKEEAERRAAQEEADREFEASSEEQRVNAKAGRQKADKTFQRTWLTIFIVIFAILFIRWLL